jgi:hypothetical protein
MENAMRKKRLLLWAGAVLTAAFAGFLVIHLVWTQRVTEENYRIIHAAMRRADVEALLGPPTGDREAALSYLDMCSAPGRLQEGYEPSPAFDVALVWHERGQSIVVGFGPSGKVNYKLYYPGQHKSPFALLRRRLGL